MCGGIGVWPTDDDVDDLDDFDEFEDYEPVYDDDNPPDWLDEDIPLEPEQTDVVA